MQKSWLPILRCRLHGSMKPRELSFTEVTDGSFSVYGKPGHFHWHVTGLRNSIVVEAYKKDMMVSGIGPYRWVREI